MKITYEEILKLKGLKRGNLITINGVIYEVAKTVKGYKLWSDEKLGYEELSFLIEKNFEKVEQKIWTEDTYKLGEDSAFFVSFTGDVTWHRIHKEENLRVFSNHIYFTKRKYAEEYLEELKKFNQEYKEKIKYD